jgi:hypothetical protein
MLVWPTNSQADEPVLGRWSIPTLDENYIAYAMGEIDATFEELSRGEAY